MQRFGWLLQVPQRLGRRATLTTTPTICSRRAGHARLLSNPSTTGEEPGRTVSRPLRGMRDLLPQDAEPLSCVEQTMTQQCQRYGFREIRTPLLERVSLFTHSLGEQSDAVQKEMYRFKDSDELVTLRPENTAGVLRALLDSGYASGVQRLWYSGPMFRRERPQKGRYRQFCQFGVELIGSAHPHADVEVIALAADCLRNLGILDRVTLQINSLGEISDRDRFQSALQQYLSPIAHRLSPDSAARLDRGSVLRILDTKDENDLELLTKAPSIPEYLSQFSRDRFTSVLRGLDLLGIRYELTPRLVRGLDYYEHTAFEFVELDSPPTSSASTESNQASPQASPRRQSTVLAGGRYDTLYASMGGADLSGVGWAAGIERIVALRDVVGVATVSSKKIRSVAVIALRASDSSASGVDDVSSHALSVTQALRSAGFTVHYEHSGNVKNQMSKADRLGAHACILIGSNELSNQCLGIKDMTSGNQVSVAAAKVQGGVKPDLSAAINHLKSIGCTV